VPRHAHRESVLENDLPSDVCAEMLEACIEVERAKTTHGRTRWRLKGWRRRIQGPHESPTPDACSSALSLRGQRRRIGKPPRTLREDDGAATNSDPYASRQSDSQATRIILDAAEILPVNKAEPQPNILSLLLPSAFPARGRLPYRAIRLLR
jgi:hypothetical protein